MFSCILVQKKQTNCEINFYILWLGIANKYGSLNCQFLKLVPPGFRAQNGKYFPLPEDSGLRTKGSSFQGKNLYLVHGSADDNVHIQNTDILSQALVKENIQFKLQVIRYFVQI